MFKQKAENFIIVIFFSEKDLKLHVETLDMVKCSDGSAEGLTNCIKQVIEKNSIPWQNIVGFCADTTNVMFGTSFASKLMKAMVPHILNVKCSCHLIHLCSSCACLSLPKTLEDLATVRKLVNDVASNFLELDYICSVGLFTKLNPYLSSEYLPLNQTYVGIATIDSMQELVNAQEPSDNIDLFYQSCKNYYTILIKQIQDRFKFEDEIYVILALFEPRNARNFEAKISKATIYEISCSTRKVLRPKNRRRMEISDNDRCH